MSYEPTKWQDHIVEYPGEYELKKTSRGTYIIKPAGKVLQEGTQQNAENFNKMEMALLELFKALSFINAADVSVTDEGDYFGSNNVESVLQEAGKSLSDIWSALGSDYNISRNLRQLTKYCNGYATELEGDFAKLEINGWFSVDTAKWSGLPDTTENPVLFNFLISASTILQVLFYLNSGVRYYRTIKRSDFSVSRDWDTFDCPIVDLGGYFDSNNVEGALQEIGEKGALVTLTAEQLDALDNLFALAAYKDEASSAAYAAFVEAFGLNKYVVYRNLDSSDIVPCGVSNIYNIGLDYTTVTQYEGIPYTRYGSGIARSCYPYFDIPIDSGYSYQIYFEANDGVKVGFEFYNETALAAVKAGEDYAQKDSSSADGFHNSMEFEWTPTTVNGLPVKCGRVSFDSTNAGVKKVIIYRKKVE